MSETGLDVFDKTLHKTHILLADLEKELGIGKQSAWHLLTATLRTVRDRLPADLSAHLAAQLPLLLRGAYYEQYEPAKQPEPLRSQEEFLEHVRATPGLTDPVDARTVAAVLQVVTRHVDSGVVDKIKLALPDEVGSLWAA